MKRLIILITVLLIVACSDDEPIELPGKGSQGSSLSLTNDPNEFDSGDDFDILNASIINDQRL